MIYQPANKQCKYSLCGYGKKLVQREKTGIKGSESNSQEQFSCCRSQSQEACYASTLPSLQTTLEMFEG